MAIKRKVITVAIIVIYLVSIMIPAVKAEEITYRSAETGTITVSYYDDSDKKIPVVGSTWRLFKVGDITTTLNDEDIDVDALEITSLIDGLDITRKTTPEEVMEYISYKVVTESKLNIGYSTINDEKLEAYDATTNEYGKAVFKDIPEGVYLGVEINAARYHLRSSPFLVSIPWTDEDGHPSYLEMEIEPKAITAGDIVIQKKTYGDDVTPDVYWNMTVRLPEGIYYYETSRGRTGYIKNLDCVGIRAYTTMTIYNVPAGSTYLVEEAEANSDGYKTWYDNQSATIKEKQENWTVVHNERYKSNVKTGTGKSMIIAAGISAVTLTAIVVLLAIKKKKEDNVDD